MFTPEKIWNDTIQWMESPANQQRKYKSFFPDPSHLLYTHWRPLPTATLTHWGRVTHICVSKQTIIGSDNGLSPGRRQAIIWTNAGILLIGPLGTNFSENLIKLLTLSFTKMRLNVSSAKMAAILSRPQCVNSLPLGTFSCNLKWVIFKLILSLEHFLWNCHQRNAFTDDWSTLVQEMAWYPHATSHHLSQCWLWSMPSFDHNEFTHLRVHQNHLEIKFWDVVTKFNFNPLSAETGIFCEN